jgi:hypothetical protein
MTSRPPAATDRDGRVRAAIYRTQLLTNRTPHFTVQTRREANAALETLERQLGRNQVSVGDSVGAIEKLMRAHASLAFGLLRDPDFADRFAPALRQLGLRGITERLDEATSSVMAEPIPGPTGGRRHRDELPTEERLDANGNPLPPPPGYY